MSDPGQAKATQLRNIEAKTGASLDDWRKAVEGAGHAKHGAVRSWAMDYYGLGYGDANALAAAVLAAEASANAGFGDPVAELYSGGKAHLRPVHDHVVAKLATWGEFEAVPKKAYVSLRRKKQFATLGPKNIKQVELGLNLKADVTSEKIVAQKPGGMCQFVVALAAPGDFDEEVQSTLKAAYEAAG